MYGRGVDFLFTCNRVFVLYFLGLGLLIHNIYPILYVGSYIYNIDKTPSVCGKGILSRRRTNLLNDVSLHFSSLIYNRDARLLWGPAKRKAPAGKRWG